MRKPPIPPPPRVIKEGGGFAGTVTGIAFIVLVFAMGFLTAVLSICKECF